MNLKSTEIIGQSACGGASGVARVLPEGGNLRQGCFEEGQQNNRIPSKAIKYAKSPTSRGGGGGARQGARMSRGEAVAPLPPLATLLAGTTHSPYHNG